MTRNRSSRPKCSVKNVFLEISQNSQENNCARVCLLVKLQGSGVFLWILRNFLGHLFLQNASGDCFWTNHSISLEANRNDSHSSAQIFGRCKLCIAHARLRKSLHVLIREIHILSKDVLCIIFSKNSHRKLDN